MGSMIGLTEISLTPLGKKKVEDMRGSGPAFAVLGQVYESGGMTVSELQSATSMGLGRLVGILKVLKKEGYIRTHKTSAVGLEIP